MILVSFQAISISITFYERLSQKGPFFNFNPIFFSLTQAAISTCHRDEFSQTLCAFDPSRLFLRSNFWHLWTKYVCCEIYDSIWEADTKNKHKQTHVDQANFKPVQRNRVKIPCTSGKRHVMSSVLTLNTNLMWSRAFSSYNPPPYKRTCRIDLSKYSRCHCFGQKSNYWLMYRKCLKNHDAEEENLFYL